MQLLSNMGAGFIRAHEGYVGKYYLDPVGVPTIGIGFTWRSSAFQQWWAANKSVKFGPGATMTRAEADSALIFLAEREYGKSVNLFLGADVKRYVFDAMVSVVYNCGAGTLEDRWAAAAKRGLYATAADLLETTRVTAKGKRLAGLVRRRKEEAALLEFGRYTGVSVAPDAMADGMLTRGERGPAVAALIKDLAALGYYEGVMDDVYGFGTEAAVLAFQRAKDLEADGDAGPKTLAAIAAALAEKGKTPAPVMPEAQPWRMVIIAAILSLFRKEPS